MYTDCEQPLRLVTTRTIFLRNRDLSILKNRSLGNEGGTIHDYIELIDNVHCKYKIFRCKEDILLC